MLPATRELSPGAVLRVLAVAGVELPPDAGREKIILHCPLHPDSRPSAFVSPSRNLLYCATCGSFTVKGLAEAFGLPWPAVLGPCRSVDLPRRPVPPPKETPPAFTPELAAEAWQVCLRRVRDPQARVEDREVLEYLAARGLAGVLDVEEGLLGIPPLDPRALPKECSTFYPRGVAVYRLVAPLWRPGSDLPISVQARAVRPLPRGAPRVMSPRGSRQSGALFANRAGRDALAGKEPGGSPATLAEGLTDFLALSAAAPGLPVLSTPGAGGAGRAVGEWARGRTVFLALDADEAGEAGARRAAGRVRELGGRPIRLRWPGGLKDAADLAKARGLKWLGEELRRIVRAAGEET